MKSIHFKNGFKVLRCLVTALLYLIKYDDLKYTSGTQAFLYTFLMIYIVSYRLSNIGKTSFLGHSFINTLLSKAFLLYSYISNIKSYCSIQPHLSDIYLYL